MKRLFIILLILEAAMLLVLALPVLHRRASYDQAETAWKEERTDEALAAFRREQARRDRQVVIAFAAVAGLCANALALCFVFDRLTNDQPLARRRGRPVLSRRRRWMKRTAQLALLAAVGMMGGGGFTFAGALRAPATSGLHSLILILTGGMLAFGAVLAWMLAAAADQAVPVDHEEDTAATKT
ncbi:MAG: hypothetical protein GX591_17630 [Planctomycetes bacterium]|nr:hypothetical protein [Planctomycetota bacterium]